MTSQTTSYRVYYEDTDAGGVVYHANYLKFAERARTEWLRSLGFEQSKLMLEEKILLPVYHLEIKFLAPAQLDDLLVIETQLLELRNVSLRVRQAIKCENMKIASLDTSIACVNLQKKPTGWPHHFYETLKNLLNGSENFRVT